MLKAMPHTVEARQELLEQCRSYYCGNQSQLTKIDEFERNYNAANAVQWYTKSCFLFRLLNKALRTGDIAGLYVFRYFISDLSTILEVAHAKQNITRVYRGGHMNRDEIENYSVGTLVAANAFLSTSRDVSVAERFIGLDWATRKSPSKSREDQQQFALFTINIDWDLSPDITLADISAQSDFPDENEVLFDIGTTFEITEINYDCEHYLWHIQMQPSMEVVQRNREYEHYIRQRLSETNSTLLFGILLTDMGEYEQSATYFQRLLTQMPDDHEDRPNAYYSAARVYRFTNQHKKALEFLHRAENLQRAKLPESSFDLARTLAGIASVYYELQDYQQELLYYQQSMAIYQQILPEDHIEMARTFNRLGFAYANQKQYTIALNYLSKSLTVYDHTVPDVHPDKAYALHNTGLVHHALGHFDESLDFYHKALKMRQITLPPHHPNIAQSCHRLSLLYEEQGQNDLGMEYARRALAIYEKNRLNNHQLIHEVETLIERLHDKSTAQV
jgi:tetratricopeptide (TPR) repeat protein